MRIPGSHQNAAPELKMTPMIDVVFLLLVFFIWTSSFELPEFDLPSAIAETPAGGSQQGVQQPTVEAFDEIIVHISIRQAAVHLEMNGQIFDSIESLQSQLAEILALGVQPPVIVDPDESVTMNTAVAVYDAARLAGADRVLFAVRPESN